MESKARPKFQWFRNEIILRNSGLMTWEARCTVLEKWTDIKGLSFYANLAAHAQPSDNPGHVKLGLDFLTANTDMQLHADIKSGQTELVVSRKESSAFHWGGTAIVHPTAKNQLQKYDFGVLAEPVKNFLVGFKHQSLNKDAVTPGKLFFYFMNQTVLNRFTSELIYDVSKKDLGVRLGATHKFTPEVMGYGKVTSAGRLDAMVKVRVNNSV